MVRKKDNRLPTHQRFKIDSEVEKILLGIDEGDRSGYIRQAIKEKYKRDKGGKN